MDEGWRDVDMGQHHSYIMLLTMDARSGAKGSWNFKNDDTINCVLSAQKILVYIKIIVAENKSL